MERATSELLDGIWSRSECRIGSPRTERADRLPRDLYRAIVVLNESVEEFASTVVGVRSGEYELQKQETVTFGEESSIGGIVDVVLAGTDGDQEEEGESRDDDEDDEYPVVDIRNEKESWLHESHRSDDEDAGS